jgi:hypothetical protein
MLQLRVEQCDSLTDINGNRTDLLQEFFIVMYLVCTHFVCCLTAFRCNLQAAFFSCSGFDHRITVKRLRISKHNFDLQGNLATTFNNTYHNIHTYTITPIYSLCCSYSRHFLYHYFGVRESIHFIMSFVISFKRETGLASRWQYGLTALLQRWSARRLTGSLTREKKNRSNFGSLPTIDTFFSITPTRLAYWSK